MRSCEKCGATEKEVMLQTVPIYQNIIGFEKIGKMLWCINCIYRSKKYPIIYGTAGEMATAELIVLTEDSSTIEVNEFDAQPMLAQGFAKKLRVGLGGHQKENFNTSVGMEYTNEFGWRTFATDNRQMLRPWNEKFVSGIDPYRKDSLLEQQEMMPVKPPIIGILDLMNEHDAKVQSHVEYNRAMTERLSEEIEQENINVGRVLGWKIENNI